MTRTVHSPKGIRLVAGAAVLGVAASMTALAAPQASATVTSIGILPSFTLGLHRYGTGCSYTVQVTVDDKTKPVFFYEEGQGPSGFAEAMPADNGTASVTWTPSSTKITYIYAFQPNATFQTRQPVTVGNGINLGSACIAL